MKEIARPFMPPRPADAPPEPDYSKPGVLEEIATQAGLEPERALDMTWSYEYPDEDALRRALVAPAGIGVLVGPDRDQGFVLCAGPLAGSEHGRLRVLLIVNADSEAEIQRRLADDPGRPQANSRSPTLRRGTSSSARSGSPPRPLPQARPHEQSPPVAGPEPAHHPP
jgi:hypothetical protein